MEHAPPRAAAALLRQPQVSHDRLSVGEGDRLLLELKTPWRGGTTHLLLEPSELIEKLAALVPRPRANLVIYHGVLAAHAAWRARVVSYGREDEAAVEAAGGPTPPARSSARQRYQWAELMRRAYGFDLLKCPRCGARMRFVASILRSSELRRILGHLGLPAEPLPVRPARPPPPELDFGV